MRENNNLVNIFLMKAKMQIHLTEKSLALFLYPQHLSALSKTEIGDTADILKSSQQLFFS